MFGWNQDNFDKNITTKNNHKIEKTFDNYFEEKWEQDSKFSYKNENRKRNIRLFIIIFSVVLILIAGLSFGYYTGRNNLFKKPDYKSNNNTIDQTPNYNGDNNGITQNTGGEILTIQKIAQKCGPAIVGIETKITLNDAFGFSVEEGTGAGSGIIIRSDGYIVTNSHVVEKASSLAVILSNGKNYPAKLIGKDSKSDLAVIKIEGSNFPVAELGISSQLKVGDLAVAIGNPLGQEFAGSVTSGIISGLNRYIMVDDRQYNLIQTDAAINSGNSGGALLNNQGKVVGINTIKVVTTGSEGLGFAIPIDDAKPIIDELITNGRISGRPSTGILATRDITDQISQIYDLPIGVYVTRIKAFGAAERAGLKVGDIIDKTNGQSVKTRGEFEKIINKLKAGDQVSIEVKRKTVFNRLDSVTLNLTLDEQK